MTVFLRQPRAGVVAEINRLTVEERKLSDERNELHARIDETYLAAPLSSEDVALLDELEGLEYILSSQRARVHLRIDQLRAQIGLPPWRQSRDEARAPGEDDSLSAARQNGRGPLAARHDVLPG